MSLYQLIMIFFCIVFGSRAVVKTAYQNAWLFGDFVVIGLIGVLTLHSFVGLSQ